MVSIVQTVQQAEEAQPLTLPRLLLYLIWQKELTAGYHHVERTPICFYCAATVFSELTGLLSKFSQKGCGLDGGPKYNNALH